MLSRLERLEQDFNPEDVHDVLTLLAAARSGLSEKELEDVLEKREIGDSPVSSAKADSLGTVPIFS